MGGRCEVVFGNDCPASWGIRIVEVGAKFFYQDNAGTIVREWYTNQNTNILAGGRVSLFSDDAAGCVQQIFAVVKVSAPGQPDQVFTGTDVTDYTTCLIQCPFVIGPKIFGTASAALTLEDAIANPDINFFTGSVAKMMRAVESEDLVLRALAANEAS